jgi:hypothetical protein
LILTLILVNICDVLYIIILTIKSRNNSDCD